MTIAIPAPRLSTDVRHHALYRRERDWVARCVGIVAALVSIGAYIVTVRHGAVLTYNDAISHQEIARRVLDNPSTSHAAQLGTVWLPLPHILMLPLVWITPLYQSGFAGAVVSMASFVITAVLLYKVAYRLTDSRFGGVVAAGVFVCNANMLYMQSTPMTEALLFCTMIATVYLVQRWAQTGRYQYLVGAACASIAAILSRYESWPIVLTLAFVVVIIAWQQRPAGIKLEPAQLRGRMLDRVVIFGIVPFLTGLAWAVWGLLIDGDPLAFQNGEYAKASLWVDKNDIAIGNWPLAVKGYWYAVVDNMSWPVVLAAGVGLVTFVAYEFRSKRAFVRALPVLSLLVIVPFFVVCLYTGQRPLRVMEVNGGYYNVRFGLFMLLPCAIFIGYLVGRLCAIRSKVVLGIGCTLGALGLVGVVAIAASSYRHHDVVTFNEPQGFVTSPDYIDQRELSGWLNGNYDDKLVLLHTVGNEVVTFYGLPSSRVISEGSYRLWQPALVDPAGSHIEWIVMRGGNTPDKVYKAMTSAPGKLAAYKVAYKTPDGNYTVYRLGK